MARIMRLVVLSTLAVFASAATPAVASWSAPPLVLGQPSEQFASEEHALVVGPDGVATAVWMEGGDATPLRVFAARSEGTGWGPTTQIGTPPGFASGLRVAAAPDGTAIAVWANRGETSGSSIRFSRFDGSVWSPGAAVAESGADFPDIAVVVAGNGIPVVAFGDSVATIDSLRTTRLVEGVWSAPVPLSGGTEDAYNPALVSDPDGTVTAAWYEENVPTPPVGRRILARRATPEGVWGSTALVSPPGSDIRPPVLARAPDGTIVAAWSREPLSEPTEVVEAARFVASAWEPSVQLSTSGTPSRRVDLAIGPDGVAVAAWDADDTVQFARRTEGGWSDIPVSLGAPGLSSGPRVTVGPDLVTTILWGVDADQDALTAARGVGGSFGPPEAVGPAADELSAIRAVARPDGAVIATWRTRGAQTSGVNSSRFRVPPSAPGAVSATAGEGQALVSWAAPVADGGAPVESYTATATPGGATCTTTAALACTITGLAPGVAHTFAVTAAGPGGTSPVSASSAPVVPTGPPGPGDGDPTPTPPPPGGDPTPPPAAGGTIPPPPSAGGGDPAPTPIARPVLRALTLSPARVLLRAGARTPVVRIGVRLDRAVPLRLVVTRTLPGRRRGVRCVAPTRALIRAKARPCVRQVAVATLVRPGRAGLNRIALTGLKVGRRTLGPGVYRLRLQAGRAGALSRPLATTLRVIRAPRPR